MTATYPYPLDQLSARALKWLRSDAFAYAPLWSNVFNDDTLVRYKYDKRFEKVTTLGDDDAPVQALFKPLTHMFNLTIGCQMGKLIRQQFRTDASFLTGELRASPIQYSSDKMSLTVRLARKRLAARTAMEARAILQRLTTHGEVRKMARSVFKCSSLSVDGNSQIPKAPLASAAICLSINDRNGNMTWGDESTWDLVQREGMAESPREDIVALSPDFTGTPFPVQPNYNQDVDGVNLWAQARLQLVSKHLRLVVIDLTMKDTDGEPALYQFVGNDALSSLKLLYDETEKMPGFGSSVFLYAYPITLTYEDAMFKSSKTQPKVCEVFTPIHCDQLLIVRGPKPDMRMGSGVNASVKKDWRMSSRQNGGVVEMEE